MTTTPRRIQLRRTKGWRKPKGAVVVARPTRWGNPWVVDAARATNPPTNNARATADECVALFRDWVEWSSPPGYVERARRDLAGRDLACWCPLDQPCHADVLLRIANGGGAA
ncbi:DUF4326 domain-containing protein [Thalassiella azotivora]